MPWPVIHGMNGPKEYRAWAEIKRRCLNKNSKDYARYGAKGVTVDADIANSFDAFFQEVGHAPSPQHSIDRIDGTRGYIKGNMRWATIGEQAANRKTTWRVTIKGVTYGSFSEAARALNVSKVTVRKWCQGYTDKRWRGYTYPPKEGCSCERKY
jgi:hypothetical protein